MRHEVSVEEKDLQDILSNWLMLIYLLSATSDLLYLDIFIHFYHCSGRFQVVFNKILETRIISLFSSHFWRVWSFQLVIIFHYLVLSLLSLSRMCFGLSGFINQSKISQLFWDEFEDYLLCVVLRYRVYHTSLLTIVSTVSGTRLFIGKFLSWTLCPLDEPGILLRTVRPFYIEEL